MIFGRSFFRDFFDCFLRAKFNVAQSTLYDYRGIDGTGTASNPVSDKNSSNYVEYTVRKLADGNCWMSENLKLTLTNNQPVLVGTFSGEETSWTPTGDGAGDDYNEAINANTKADVNGGNWYYPWYAATAGQGTNTASPTISQSICPKGWKLPNGGANAAPSFASLITTTYGIASSSAGSTTLQSAPLSFYYAGVYYFGSLNDTSYGYYWSASPYTRYNHLAYNLTFSSSYVYLQDNYNKSYGFSVRCVAIP
ncbi:fibrobacter succinogenes major paralogous domain-containing protein [Candidatus Saccharibacteria bacterium]|nr:fibrobacter succinogenes major paralogous domain-containing protein [Candidatus Saccharibacteria bacterium]